MARLVLVVAPPRQLEPWESALRARGFEVLRAAGRADALTELRRANVAAVLVSEKLPWNGALRITRAVRSNAEFVGVPVVAVGLPQVSPTLRLRVRGGFPDSTLPARATPEEVAAAVAAAVERGPLPPVQLTPEQERALRLGRIGNVLMAFGVIFSLSRSGPSSSANAWWLLLVPLGGLLADYSTGRVDGRARALSWQGWAAVVLMVALAVVIVRWPGFFVLPMRR